MCSNSNIYLYRTVVVSFIQLECLYEISPHLLFPVYISTYSEIWNSGECKRRMLLCNGDSDAGNAKGHFGKDLHEDGGQCGLRIKLNLLPAKEREWKI